MTPAAVALPGVVAQTPMGLLVALGTLDVLTEHVAPDTRLWWKATQTGGHLAVISVPRALSPDDVAQLVFEALADDPLAGLMEVAADLNKVAPADLHRALTSRGVPWLRVLCGLCAEAPLRPQGQSAMTPLAITSFKGRRSVFATVLRADAAVSEAHLRAVYGGRWSYERKIPTLNLDPAAREQDSARMAADASADGTRGAPGTLPLAVRGLSLLSPLPSRVRPRLPALNERRSSRSVAAARLLVWPVWERPLSRFGARALLGRDWLEREPDAETLTACGILAIYQSAIVAVKDGSRLARARRIA